MVMSAGQSVPNATRSTPTVLISILRAGRFLGASRPENIVLPTTRKVQAGRSRAGGCKPFLAYCNAPHADAVKLALPTKSSAERRTKLSQWSRSLPKQGTRVVAGGAWVERGQSRAAGGRPHRKGAVVTAQRSSRTATMASATKSLRCSGRCSHGPNS